MPVDDVEVEPLVLELELELRLLLIFAVPTTLLLLEVILRELNIVVFDRLDANCDC